MGQPAYRVLEEFETDTPPVPRSLAGLKTRTVEVRRPPDATALRIQEAYAQGHADGELSERAIADARIAELTADFELRLAEERSRLAGTLADRIVESLRAGLEGARQRLATDLAAVLVPVLRRTISESAILELVDEVARILERDEAIVIDMWGDQRFTDLVCEGIAARIGGGEEAVLQRIRRHPSSGPEITVAYGDAVIETRLAEWLRHIEEARGQ